MTPEYPWTRPGLSMPDRLMTMMDCLMDVDTVKGTVTYRYDVGKYPGKWQPYRPVTSLRFSVAGTAEIYNLGLKELVWASAHRRLPTGVRFHQPGLDKGLYAADNLYQLEAPPLSKRYGWEYAAGRLPALVDTLEVTATQAVVQILPHNFVLEEDEEHHLPRRKIKMRLMRQLTQSNLKPFSYWQVPLEAGGRVTRELLFLHNHHPNYQPAYPPVTAEFVVPIGEIVRQADQVHTWSTRRRDKPEGAEYVDRRREEVLAEAPPLSRTPEGRVRRIRGELALAEARREFEQELIRTLCGNHD